MTSKLQLSGALRLLFRLPAILYRWRCGWLLGRRFLLLIHVGRRTGKLRRTVLEVIEYRRDLVEALVISAFLLQVRLASQYAVVTRSTRRGADLLSRPRATAFRARPVGTSGEKTSLPTPVAAPHILLSDRQFE